MGYLLRLLLHMSKRANSNFQSTPKSEFVNAASVASRKRKSAGHSPAPLVCGTRLGILPGFGKKGFGDRIKSNATLDQDILFMSTATKAALSRRSSTSAASIGRTQARPVTVARSRNASDSVLISWAVEHVTKAA
jgi:hypothetical protein